ncbi:MAG: M48 family metallopeptidase [Candidatus Omnitrophica bacterium]|nr:M48 family metallopeptidase [Candidatus Omnitrophota bacterium]
MTPSQPVDDARRYARARRRLLLVDLAYSALVLAFIQLSSASHGIAEWARRWTSTEWLVVAGYLAVFGSLVYAAGLPLRFYGGFLLEHRFHLSRMSFAKWCLREAKHLAVSAVLGGLLIEGLYVLLRAAPRTWPLWATLGWVAFSMVLARIFPTVLLPIFYKTTPVEQETLVKRLLALCERVKLPALGVYRFNLGAETRKANAALAGLGGTRRVLLSDTLIADFTPEEIEGVLAHELAHHRYRHITKQLVISAVGSWVAFTLTRALAGFWVGWLQLEGLADIAGFPALALWLSVLGLIGLPIQNGLSRHFEWQSDRFAVQTASRPRAFAAALRRLAALNLADPNPPRWVVWMFYDHPPITERIRAAEQTA